MSLSPNLTHLDLSANSLTSWSVTATVTLPSLENLKVSYNDLSDLTGLTSFPNLVMLEAKGNNLGTPRSILPLSNW